MEKKDTGLVIAVSVIIVGIVLAIIIGALSTNTTETESTEIGKYAKLGKEIILTNKLKKELYEKVKKDITDDLKTPATASFPKIEEWTIRVDINNVIEVESYVDSQNSFGAMLRANFEQRYILLNSDEYLCIYKQFDKNVEYNILEDSQYDKLINKRLNKSEIDKILQASTIIYKKMTYEFDEENQLLNLTIVEDEKNSYNIRTGVYSCIKVEINQLFCMPTVTLNIVVINEKNEKLAEVKNVDFDFLINKWNTLASTGIVYSPSFEDFEEKLGEKLWQNDRIKKIDLKYLNMNVINNK
ncbi:MAG: hypothetical protein IJK18_08365 [Clostridia bacterium]|nr:hypothetical protein [Clostridia bacterium]